MLSSIYISHYVFFFLEILSEKKRLLICDCPEKKNVILNLTQPIHIIQITIAFNAIFLYTARYFFYRSILLWLACHYNAVNTLISFKKKETTTNHTKRRCQSKFVNRM